MLGRIILRPKIVFHHKAFPFTSRFRWNQSAKLQCRSFFNSSENVPHKIPKNASQVVENLQLLTPSQRIEEGFKMLKEGNQSPSAYGTFQSIEVEDPTNVRAIYGKILALEQGLRIFMKQFPEEIRDLNDSHPAIKNLKKDLNRLIQIEPKNKEWLRLRSGFRRDYFKDVKGGIEDLEMMMKLDKNDHRTILELVEIKAHEGDMDSAFKYIEKAIDSAPPDQKCEVMCTKPHLMMATGDLDGSLKELDKILAINSNTKMANVLKSSILFQKAGENKALLYESTQFVNKEIENLTSKDPKDPDLAFCYKTRGDINFKLNNYDESEKDFEMAIQVAGEKATHDHYAALGALHFNKQEYEKAIGAFSKAIDLTSHLDDKAFYEYRLQRAKCSFF